ncbi:hypothetical protein SETIT_3G269100v2 [Setaria italica]|uniref:Uncharacterized protein n=1 Tax=Setaria italica TaxID=4555 RepID=A0A368QJ96_SETIT|nr:hypothetical protein SETIT_3G269100v2 [Setaria italica]
MHPASSALHAPPSDGTLRKPPRAPSAAPPPAPRFTLRPPIFRSLAYSSSLALHRRHRPQSASPRLARPATPLLLPLPPLLGHPAPPPPLTILLSSARSPCAATPDSWRRSPGTPTASPLLLLVALSGSSPSTTSLAIPVSLPALPPGRRRFLPASPTPSTASTGPWFYPPTWVCLSPTAILYPWSAALPRRPSSSSPRSPSVLTAPCRPARHCLARDPLLAKSTTTIKQMPSPLPPCCSSLCSPPPPPQSTFASVSPSTGLSCSICPNSSAVRLRGAEVQTMA